MKNPNVIRIVKREQLPARVVPDPDRFEFKSDGSFPWLQRIIFALLRRLGCQSTVTLRGEIKTAYIERDSVIRALLEQQAILREFDRFRPTELFIGSDDYKELMRETSRWDYPVTFATEYNSDRQVMGLNVTVVPWMEGILIPPPRDRVY